MLVLRELVLVLRWSCRKGRQIRDSAKVVKKSGHKKTARLRWRFFGKLGFYTNDSPLSIRQRLEMPKKVKIKLGGHDGLGRVGKN
ncbi:hypothetical protein ABH944_000130 [Caballeronia udeis]|jgi:hypothetical protein|uniref:Uncharacterized protein n=1 Tax=Caballeronia udeis TaxID=1232866 RepID=A0ABW8M903_9BURK